MTKKKDDNNLPLKVIQDIEHLPDEERVQVLNQVYQKFSNEIYIFNEFSMISPEKLKEYEKLYPDFAKRMLDEYLEYFKERRKQEKLDAEHARKIESEVIENERKELEAIKEENEKNQRYNSVGQIFAGIITTLVIIGIGYCIKLGQIDLAKTLGTYTLLMVAIIFILRRLPSLKEIKDLFSKDQDSK